MDTTQPTTRDQVSPHKVNRASGPASTKRTNEKTCNQANKNAKQDDNKSAEPTLTLADGGIMKLMYNVERHTSYEMDRDRRNYCGEPSQELFGYTKSQWESILSSHPQIREALEQPSPDDRGKMLNEVVKERLMSDLQSAGVHADLFLAEGSSSNFTRWEQAACEIIQG